MLDAYELAASLTEGSFADLSAAIAHYEQEMLPRAASVTRDTLDNTILMHSINGRERLQQLFEQMGK